MTPHVAGAGVCVVIPHWGDPSLASALVDDLLRQDADFPVQVIVVDDCSPVQFPGADGVELVRRPTNGGFGAAVNDGAARSRHAWLLVANSDLRVAPDFLRRLVDAAAPLQPAVCSPELVENGERRPVANLYSAAGRRAVWRRLGWVRLLGSDDGAERRLGHDTDVRRGAVQQTEWLTGACLLLPLAAFDAVGGFDERFHMFAEDLDLQRRLRDTGVFAWSVGTVSAEHVGGASTGSDRYAAYLRADLTYERKWGAGRRALCTYVVCALLDFTYDLARDLIGRRVGAGYWLGLRLRTIRDARRRSLQDMERPSSRADERQALGD